MARIKCILAYEGTRYAGWQLQAFKAKNRPATVQGEVETALASLCGGARVPVFGSSRTDAGVHAEGQVFHFDVPEEKAGRDWCKSLNAMLPQDIRVLSAVRAPGTFHARHNVLRKTYAYALWTGKGLASPRLASFAWTVPCLDAERMCEAAAHLVGKHDFASFQNTGSDVHTTERTIFSITRVPGAAGPLICPESWPVCSWVVVGDGFLKHMVRNIMGLLVHAGLGRVEPAAVPGYLAARSRTALPSPTAEARGLTLMSVEYGSGEDEEQSDRRQAWPPC